MTSARNKVLLLIPTLGGGGAERFFSILLQHLDRNRFEPHLALFQAHGEYMQDIPQDVGVHDLKCFRGRYAPPGLVRLVWKLRPHVVLSTLPQANLALTLSRPFLPRRTRLVLSEADFTSSAMEGDMDHPRVWTWFYRRFYRRADAVVCLSSSMIDDMASNFNVPREKLVRIYYPVDLNRVRSLAEAGGNPYSGPGPHLVAVGRLCQQKGFDLLLQAMQVVRAHFAEASLTILGQGPLLAELTEQSHKLGLSRTVRFLGFHKNPWPYIKHADLFVLSSRHEGLPNVLLEALAVGTPIVATDCPGAIREVQELHPGIVMVPPEDPQALAEGIIRKLGAGAPRCKKVTASPQALSAFALQQIVADYSRLLLN